MQLHLDPLAHALPLLFVHHAEGSRRQAAGAMGGDGARAGAENARKTAGAVWFRPFSLRFRCSSSACSSSSPSPGAQSFVGKGAERGGDDPAGESSLLVRGPDRLAQRRGAMGASESSWNSFEHCVGREIASETGLEWVSRLGSFCATDGLTSTGRSGFHGIKRTELLFTQAVMDDFSFYRMGVTKRTSQVGFSPLWSLLF